MSPSRPSHPGFPPDLDAYDRILAIDSEYTPRPGRLPQGICYARRELRSGAPPVARWIHDGDVGPCPYDPDDDRTLIVCFSAAAELTFFRACSWRLPKHVYDLWIAFRIYANGRHWHSKLLDALRVFGIPHETESAEKERLQQICIRGGPFSPALMRTILAYCMSDIAPLGPLLVKLVHEVDTTQVVEFGRYVAHTVLVEERGMPIDVARLELMSRRWNEVLRATVVRANARMSFRIYGGPGRHHLSRSYERIEKLLKYTGLANNWPRTETRQLRIDKQTLRDLEGRHPSLVHLRQAEKMLHMAHPARIAVGPDDRSRTPARAFAASTSRNLGRSETPLSYAGGMRAVIVPAPGRAIVIADYEQADPATAAALSQDFAMRDDYYTPAESPDFYMAFMARVGAVPDGTARLPQHEATRNTFKRVVNGLLYGIGEVTLSEMLGVEVGAARAAIRRFYAAYPTYGRWSRAVLQQASIDGFLFTQSGWAEHSVGGPAAKNFPIQATVADVHRRASLLADAAGLQTIISQHDSLGVEVESRHVFDAARKLVQVMGDAAEEIIGLRLRVGVQVVGPGERWFKDDKARDWWIEVSRALGVEP